MVTSGASRVPPAETGAPGRSNTMKPGTEPSSTISGRCRSRSASGCRGLRPAAGCGEPCPASSWPGTPPPTVLTAVDTSQVCRSQRRAMRGIAPACSHRSGQPERASDRELPRRAKDELHAATGPAPYLGLAQTASQQDGVPGPVHGDARAEARALLGAEPQQPGAVAVVPPGKPFGESAGLVQPLEE